MLPYSPSVHKPFTNEPSELALGQYSIDHIQPCIIPDLYLQTLLNFQLIFQIGHFESKVLRVSYFLHIVDNTANMKPFVHTLTLMAVTPKI